MIRGLSLSLFLFIALPTFASGNGSDSIRDVLAGHIRDFNENSSRYRLSLESLFLPSMSEIDGVVTTSYFNVSESQSLKQVVAKFAGNRSVQMTVVTEGKESSNLYVRCRFGLEVKTAVAKIALSKGDIVSDQEVSYEWVEFGLGGGPSLLQPADVIGKILVRPIGAGASFSRTFLKANNVVKRGEIAQLTIGQNQLTVTSQVKPLQNGQMGDVVQVMNLATKKVLLAEVVGSRQLRFREEVQ